MGRLDGRVAIVTGAGRGLGREHALALAREGARVVVNDLGGDVHGAGADPTPAQQVVQEIRKFGGEAVASGHDVADWDAARAMVHFAIDTFGSLDVLVNNAGIVRDRTLANMVEDEWDAVINVHLKGHVAPTKHAVEWWREQHKAGKPVHASVIMTSSIAGLAGNFGQANYSSAKLAVVALARVVSLEAGRHGVRCNAVSPGGLTRIAMTMPGAEDHYEPTPGVFDPRDPGNVSPLIVWLADPQCPADSQVFHISANRIVVSSLPPIVHELVAEGRWTLDALDRELTPRLVQPLSLERWFGQPEA